MKTIMICFGASGKPLVGCGFPSIGSGQLIGMSCLCRFTGMPSSGCCRDSGLPGAGNRFNSRALLLVRYRTIKFHIERMRCAMDNPRATTAVRDPVWLSGDSCSLDDFGALVERTTAHADYPLAETISRPGTPRSRVRREMRGTTPP